MSRYSIVDAAYDDPDRGKQLSTYGITRTFGPHSVALALNELDARIETLEKAMQALGSSPDVSVEVRAMKETLDATAAAVKLLGQK